MPDRTNITDKEQNELEQQEYQGGFPVFADGDVRVNTKQGPAGSQEREIAGVVVPGDDDPGSIDQDKIGRPG